MSHAEDIAAFRSGRIDIDELLQRVRSAKLLDGADVPLNEGQRGMIVKAKMEPDSAVYNVPWCFRVREILDPDAFANACARLYETYPLLRAIYVEPEGDPHLRICRCPLAPVDRRDVSHLDETAISRELEALATRPMMVEREPPLRIHLLTHREADHYLLFVAHHYAVDGQSLPPMMATLWETYDALVAGKSPPPVQPDTGFRDFVDRQRTWLASPAAERDFEYWRSVLADPWPSLALSGPGELTSTGALPGTRSRPVSARLAADVRLLARSERITLSAVFLAAYRLLLSGWSGETDIVITTAASIRGGERYPSSVGYFINMVPLRTTIAPRSTVADLLRAEQHTLASAIDHSSLPYARLLRRLGPASSAAARRGCQVAFSYIGNALMDWRAGAFAKVSQRRMVALPAPFQQADCDLLLELREGNSSFDIVAKYSGAAVGDETIELMLDTYVRVLERMVEDPQAGIARMSAAVSPPTAARWEAQHVHRLFEEVAAADPAALAVRSGDQTITYGQLNARAGRLARHLRAQGIEPGSRVALCCRSGPAFVIGMLATLKAGAAYVPLDPGNPSQRLADTVADCAPAAILSSREGAEALRGVGGPRPIYLDEEFAWSDLPSGDLANDLPADLPAYIIYTSGSSGRPKGVVVQHRGLVRLLAALRPIYAMDRADRVLQFTSIAFDVSVLEILVALTTGASIVLRNDRWIESPDRFRQLCGEHGVTIVHMPASLWHRFLVADGVSAPASLRLVVVGGEAISGNWLDAWHAQNPGTPRLLNQYGPTEATIVATLAELTDARTPTIGQPLAHVELYVVAENGAIADDGEGELLIGGPGVATGYLGQPHLTAQCFVPDRFSDLAGAVLYRTGDRVRRTPSGDLEFRGRLDRQTKLRGFRIELEEIEAQLARHPAIAEAAVIVVGELSDADRRLVAYIVSAGPDVLSAADLRTYAASVLPDHMVPAAFVKLEALPLGPTGKRDLGALPPVVDQPCADDGADPRTPLEEALVSIYAELLKVERIGIHDNFFEHGGDSLKAAQVIARIRQLLDLELPLPMLFEAQSVAELSEEIVAMLDDDDNDIKSIS